MGQSAGERLEGVHGAVETELPAGGGSDEVGEELRGIGRGEEGGE